MADIGKTRAGIGWPGAGIGKADILVAGPGCWAGAGIVMADLGGPAPSPQKTSPNKEPFQLTQSKWMWAARPTKNKFKPIHKKGVRNQIQ